MTATSLVWLRRDLRLEDNPALDAAVASGGRVIPVYVHAPHEEAPWQPGAASRWWLHQSLRALAERIGLLGGRLIIARGDTLPSLRRLARETGARHCFWNRLYDPATVRRDSAVKQGLRADGIRCESFGAALMREPWEIKTGAGEPYRVFTPYWRRCRDRLGELATPLPAPSALPGPAQWPDSATVDALELLPTIRWDQGLRESWQPGERGAAERLERFLDAAIEGYDEGRERPGEQGTSGLSPHLHWGEIGPRQILAAIRDRGPGAHAGAEHFIRELGWRDFSHQLLFHFPQTPLEPLDPRFAAFPWREDPNDTLLRAWQRGRTGVPIVDAGMRELWHTGWMHNRVRMIVASLLTKNLRLPWQHGARWFWDTLVDADLASNTQGWQWSAGSGADAAPYFRIFNPVLQGERFDPRGVYVRRWCPELRDLPDKLIHQPWAARPAAPEQAGIAPGRDYPEPVVDLKQSRAEALAAYEQVKARAR